jgi:prepilin-type N-terminal cleavage/methylation domain-containing protein
MVQQYMKCLLASRTSAKGFTLIEMIIGIALTVTVSGLALAALTNAEQGFSKDKNIIEGNQKLASVIDILGRDITQAGEEINDPKFPVFTVTPDGVNGSRIIIYRGLESALSLCSATNATLANALTSGTPPPGNILQLTSTDNGVQLTNSPCIPSAPPIAPAVAEYPNNVKEWVDRRVANGGQIAFFLHDLNGNIQLVNLTGETTKTSFQGVGGLIVAPFTPARNYPNRSTLNLVEKKEYLICGSGTVSDPKVLKVRINSNTEGSCSDTGANADSLTFPFKTIATNITRLDIGMPNTTNPTPADNLAFPSGGLTWRNLRGVTIKLTAKNPDSNLNTFITADGRFYPRNILSTNAL